MKKIVSLNSFTVDKKLFVLEIVYFSYKQFALSLKKFSYKVYRRGYLLL